MAYTEAKLKSFLDETLNRYEKQLDEKIYEFIYNGRTSTVRNIEVEANGVPIDLHKALIKRYNDAGWSASFKRGRLWLRLKAPKPEDSRAIKVE